MTPGARVAAAIEILDRVRAGAAAEQTLTQWARRSRFAGSKDRAAVRDHVFDALRRWRSAEALGGGSSGRARMIGLLREDGLDPSEVFTGEGHAPSPLSEAEQAPRGISESCGVRWNLPDWLVPEFEESLGDDAEKAALALQARAPVTLRVNLAKTTRDTAQEALSGDGITSSANPLCDTALTVTEGARRLKGSQPFCDGWVDLQDAASQAIIAELPRGLKCLDYCAGGGGKALAMAAEGRTVFAHDIEPRRMNDLPSRAARAGAKITLLAGSELSNHAPYDLVLCDAPCSGSGAWRRAPQGKWMLTAERLWELVDIQAEILDRAKDLVGPGGTLVYATCSVLRRENEDAVARFLARNVGWICGFSRRLDIGQHGDGFFSAHLTRVKL